MFLCLQITNYQLEAIQERKMLLNKKKKKKQNDSPSEVSFSCRGCNKDVCRGEDIEVVSQMHHVVVSTEFRYGEHRVKGHVGTLRFESWS